MISNSPGTLYVLSTTNLAHVLSTHLFCYSGQPVCICFSNSPNTPVLINVKDHHGPVTCYMADCGGDCSKFSVNDAKWFKIDEMGYIGPDQNWATDKLIAGTYTNSSVVLLADSKMNRWYLVDLQDSRCTF